MREEWLEIQRIMEIVGQQLQIQHLRFKPTRIRSKRFDDGEKHVLPQTAVRLFAAAHQFRVDLLPCCSGFIRSKNIRRVIAKQGNCHRSEQTTYGVKNDLKLVP